MKEKHFNLIMLIVIVGGIMAIPTVKKNSMNLGYKYSESIITVLPHEISGVILVRLGCISTPVIGLAIVYDLYRALKEDNKKWSSGRS